MKTNRILVLSLALVVALGVTSLASAQGTLFVENNRVSIGTPTPTAPLDINIGTNTPGSGNSVLRLERVGPLGFQMKDTNSADFWQFSAATGAAAFRINNSTTPGVALSLSKTGNLTILGSIFTANCAPCVSDYVFESDWELMPLEDLEEFVWTNRHLPNVPSQKDVDEAGALDLVTMQMKMLEKIEELTLYTIEQHKKIANLETRLAEIER